MTPPEDRLPPTRLAAAPPLLSRKTLLVIGMLVALVVGLFGWSIWLGKQSRQTARAQPTATSSTTVVVGNLPATMTPQATGWDNAGPAWAQNIAFAPSAGNTAYACGAADNAYQTKRQWPIRVAMSPDGGASWDYTNLAGAGNECAVRISPANPQYAVLAVDSGLCPDCPGASLFRTLDGGQTWTQVVLPPVNGMVYDQFSGYAWAGIALFVTPFAGLGVPVNDYLAESRAGGAFAWVAHAGLYGSAAPTTITQVIGAGDALVAIFAQPKCSACQVVASTADGGVSWAHVTPMDGQIPITIFQGGAAPGTLYGEAVAPGNGRLERSTDLGRTWQTLPRIPPFFNLTQFFDAPDGTIYGVFVNGIDALAPGATTWKNIAPLPPSNLLQTVQVDGAGRPLALWALAAFNTASLSGLQEPGLLRHTP